MSGDVLWQMSVEWFWQMCQANTRFWLYVVPIMAPTNEGVILRAPIRDDSNLAWAYEALSAAAAGRLDAAYDIALLQLDALLSDKKWDDAARALDIIVDSDEDVDLGIAALRFAAFARDDIPGWQGLLEEIEGKLEDRGESAARALRGLL